jgi:hypothetical protein
VASDVAAVGSRALGAAKGAEKLDILNGRRRFSALKF